MHTLFHDKIERFHEVPQNALWSPVLLPKAGESSNPGLQPPPLHRISCVILVSAALDPKDGGDLCFSNKWAASPEDPSVDSGYFSHFLFNLTSSSSEVNKAHGSFIKNCHSWCSSVDWVWAVKQRVAASIPSEGTCRGCGPGPQWGPCKRQPHTDVSLPLFLPPFSSL